jgi:hypothetical protein
MKFSRHSTDGTKIEFTLHEDADLNTVLEEFQNFLRACGYTIEYNKVIDIVNMDQV